MEEALTRFHQERRRIDTPYHQCGCGRTGGGQTHGRGAAAMVGEEAVGKGLW